jgi:CrcB protein
MRSALAVATGAAIGAAARWAVGEMLASEGFPWATLVVNVVGCAVMGWCAVTIARRTPAWYFVATGVLGGFTTASAFGVDTRQLLDDGRTVAALAYVAASFGLGLAALSTTRAAALRRAAS